MSDPLLEKKKSNNIKELKSKIPKPNTSKQTKKKEIVDSGRKNIIKKENKSQISNTKNIEEDINYDLVKFEDDKNFQTIKDELNKASNFIDYFLIIGVDPNIFKNEWLYTSDFDELNKREELKPKIISYFPPYEKLTIAFDDSIIMHCFPNGYNLIKSETKPNYKIFSFILDNNYFNLNYPQKYLTCLMFYESISQYRELYNMNQTFENELRGKNLLIKKNSDMFQENNEIYIPKCLMLMSLYPFFSEFERILLQIYDYSTNKIQLIKEKEKKINKIDNNEFIKKDSELFLMRKSIKEDIIKGKKLISKRSRSNAKREEEPNENENQENNDDDNLSMTSRRRQRGFGTSIKGFYNKVMDKIGSANTTPNPSTQRLNSNLLNRKKTIIQPEKYTYDCYLLIDKFIENLLIELPVPPKGETKIIYTLMNDVRELKQNKMNQLPLIDVNLKNLFIKFKIEEIIDIYHYLFLETRVLFFSQDIDILNIFIYGLLSLLYPFEYQYQIVTILPNENFEIIESITPFIAGINQRYKNDFFESRNLSLSDCILIVDLDKCELKLINNEDNTIPDFPKNFKKQLDKNLNTLLNQEKYKNIFEEREKRKKTKNYKKRSSVDYSKSNSGNLHRYNSKNMSNNSDNVNNENQIFIQNNLVNEEDVELVLNELSSFSNFNIDYEFNYELNLIFFNFNASLLANYSKFLNLSFYSSNVPASLDVLFKVKEFLKEIPNSDKDFYDRFINETQLFGDFLYKRMIPKNSQEKIRVLLFDETINENHKTIFSKAHQGVFIKSEEYDFANKYEIQKPREITKDEYSFFIKPKNKLYLLSYGIIIDEDKENNKIIFNYPVFPKLLTKIFFLKNIQEYYTNTGLSENIEIINRDIIAKSHLGGIAEKQNDMKNYIDLCWLQMWAMTFWYCDNKEKKYRFYQLVKVLEKTSSHEMEILNLLFETLEKNGEEYMVLKLYDMLIKLRLNPSFKVHNIVMKYLDKYKSGENININDILQKAIKHIATTFESKDKLKFKKRTFKSKYYKNILSEDIIFYAFDTCIYCQKIINLQSKSRHFEEMNREIMWVKCPNCNEYCLTKLCIQFGKEINKTGKMKYNTCKYYNVVLFSPYSLKMNYKILLRDCGIKLDVEELMFNYSNIFWNTLWYFKLNNLEYDFMLPYEIKFDDTIFNDNIEVMTNELYKKSLLRKENMGKKDKETYNKNKENKKEVKKFDSQLLRFESLLPIFFN